MDKQMTAHFSKNQQAWHVLRHLKSRVGAGWFLVLLLVLNLSACGFHLKGSQTGGVVAFKSAKVESNGTRREVSRGLERALKDLDVEVVDSLGKAELLIKLGSTSYNRSTTGRTPDGDVSSELLKMTQAFSVVKVATEKVLLDSVVTSYRDRSVNPNQAQASSRELRALQNTMAEDLAFQVLDRVNRVYAPGLK